MNCQMVPNNTNKNNSILLEVFASVFTVSSYFTDNPRIMSRQIHILNPKSICRKMTKKSPENEIEAKGNYSCKVNQTRPKSNLTCIMSRQIHI